MAKYQNPHIDRVYVIGWSETSKVSPTRARWVWGLVLAVLAGVSLWSLATRHLLDDEILSLPFVMLPPREILAISAAGDVHPAGMYLLAHLGWVLTGSVRWLNLLPWAVLYAGLAVFVAEIAPLLRGSRERLLFVMLAALHPELLVWGNTFRWYCPWTGLGLLVLVAALEPRSERPRLAMGRAIGLGVLLAAMFYLNYITVLFAAALLAAMWVRFRGAARGERLRGVSVMAGTALVLAAPQLPTMFAVHLAASGGQRSGVAVSAARTVQALVGSEAFLPWHPVAIAASVVLLGVGVIAVMRRSRLFGTEGSGGGAIRALAVFGGCFFGLVVVSGLGGKPRNALLLVPVLAPVFAMGMGALSQPLQWGVLAVVLAWESLGAAHVLGEYGLEKTDRNDRPEQVVRLVREGMQRAQADGPGEQACVVVFTYDTGVTFALAQAKVPHVVVVSPSRGALFQGAVADVPEDCERPRVFLVESYPAGLKHNLVLAAEEMQASEGMLGGTRAVERLDRDPDAAAKRRLSRLARLEDGASLPDWRFVLVEGTVDREEIAAMRAKMPHFVSGQAE